MASINLGFSHCIDQANSCAASRINRPMGKFRGHDRSAALKSNRANSAPVCAGSVSKADRASVKSWYE